ncbi:MAG: trypsin-like peptidase domain-containing protein [Planctomycetes bacterium]|nr:trypsin-like peptidase domain-containing protein [Planctomycetota bacterium]
MSLRTLFVFAALGLAVSTAGAQDWNGATFKQVREATPCIRNRNTWSQSGILFRKTAAGGWVLTMSQAVEKQETVDVVFGMGTETERTLKGTVVARGDNETFACLWIECKDLPEALPIGARPELKDGDDVFLPGYRYEVDRDGPKTSAPIRLAHLKFRQVARDLNGALSSGTIEGEANPGQSGAPVMTAKGEVLGICDARPTGGRVLTVLTPESIRRFFRRHMSTITSAPSAVTREDMKLQVHVALFDPLEQLHDLTFLFIRESQVPALSPRTPWKEQTRVSAGMEEVPLRIDSDTASASADVRFVRNIDDAQSVRILCQLKLTETDAAEYFTLPLTFDVAFAPDPLPEPARPAAEVPAFDLSLPSELKIGRSAGWRCVTGELLVSPDGAAVYVLDLSQGRAVRLDAATLKMTGEFPAAGVVRCMALTPDGKTLAVAGFDPAEPSDNSNPGVTIVQFVATDTMKVTKEIRTHGRPAAVAASAQHIVLTFENQGGSMVIIDTQRDAVANVERTGPWSFVRLHPDGTRVYIGDRGSSPGDFRCLPLKPDQRLSRFVSYDSRYHGERPLGDDFEISPDGQFIVGCLGSALRLSKTAIERDDMEYVAGIERCCSIAFAPGATSFLTANRDGFIKQYDYPSFKLRTSVSLGKWCAKMLLDGKGKRLIATVASIQKEEYSYGRNLPVCDLVEIPLEGK